MSNEKGIKIKGMGVFGIFWSDVAILAHYPDGSNGMVNPLLRRAQAAEKEVERLRAAWSMLRDAVLCDPDRGNDTINWALGYIDAHCPADKSDGDNLPAAAGEQS